MDSKLVMLGSGLVVGLVLGAGGTFGWITLTAPPPEVPVLEEKPVKKEIVKVVDEQALYEARRQIEELKKQLADKSQGREPEQPKVVKEEKSGGSNDVLDQVRSFVNSKLTPEQQAEIQAQRDAFRQQMLQRATERTDFLASVDTRQMSPAQRANHDKLMASVNRMNELRNSLLEGNAQNSGELRKEMHDLSHSMDDLYQEERKYLLETTGRSLGYTGDQASLFADQIQQIYDNTSGRGMMWGGFDRGSRNNSNRPSGERN